MENKLAWHMLFSQKHMFINFLGAYSHIIQGGQTQTGFFKTAMRDRNKQVEFCLKVALKSWDVDNYENVRHTYHAQTVSEIWFLFLCSTYGSFLQWSRWTIIAKKI